ncbi:MAG: TlpA disulfide reductase family protein [Chitinophagaceae bacterium]
MKKSVLVFFIGLIAASPSLIAQTFSPFGKWRGVFQLRDGIEAPFNFEITGKSVTDAKVFFINAAERFDGGRLKKERDSLYISLDQFDNELAFKINGNKLDGVLRKIDGSGTPMKVTAEKGKLYRFPLNGSEPTGDISGTYDIVSGSKDSTVGLFTQNGRKLSATFLSITGDSRYLDGIVDGNKFYLSSFIGSGVSYYQGTFNSDGTLTGEQVTARSARQFTGRENDEAKLPDLYSLTYLKQGYSRFDFSFPDINGKKISLSDEKYKGKAVIVAITGSWCPNCMDETAFLSPWYKKNKSRGVEIVAIHYERKDDPAFVKNAIGRYKKKFDIRYDQVFGGLADKQLVANSLPSLNTFLSFPTTIFINRKGEVSKIHTGYTGPATGKFYAEFVKEFNQEVDHLLAE